MKLWILDSKLRVKCTFTQSLYGRKTFQFFGLTLSQEDIFWYQKLTVTKHEHWIKSSVNNNCNICHFGKKSWTTIEIWKCNSIWASTMILKSLNGCKGKMCLKLYVQSARLLTRFISKWWKDNINARHESRNHLPIDSICPSLTSTPFS